MNNNKKYKKWSLGLVAPALVLAPIAVVASCSSSGEEKPAYGVTFTNNNEIKATIHKAVQPADLTDVQFKEEVLAHKSDLFTIEGTLPSDSFLNDNIKITDLNPSDDKKEVSAKVKLNNANTNGEAIEKTITLKGLGYVEVDLNGKTYTIVFKVNDQNPQEIELADQSTNSVESLTAEQLMKLVIGKKDEILTITDDQKIITDDVLENQILKITDIQPNKTEGKVTFKLSVEKPKDGAGTTLEKNIVFAGFKKETDSTPPAESEKFKIKFKDATEFTLTGVEQQSVTEFSTPEKIQPIVIQNKDKIFEAESGTLPDDQDWWTKMLKISDPNQNATEGAITVKMELDGADTTETANESTTTITKEGIVLKGFRKEAQAPEAKETMINAQLSTVTLGLNGNRQEVKDQINEQWILDHARILFSQGFELIKDVNDIVAQSIVTEDINKQDGKPESGNPIKLKFKVAANKWYNNQPAEGTTEKEFETKITGISGAETLNKELKNKSEASDAKPLAISLVDPGLADGTYEEFRDNAAKIFTKKFVFDYRKHLLTGDFTKVDEGTENDFLFKYPAETTGNKPERFIKITPNDTTKSIKIEFTILKEKLVPAPSSNKEFSIVFSGFKGN